MKHEEQDTPEKDCDEAVHGVQRDDLHRAPGQQDGGASCCSYDDEDKIVAPVEIAVNKAVIEVDVRVNAEETHDESDKGTVMFPKPFPLMLLPTPLMIILRSSGQCLLPPVNIEQEVRAVLDNSRVQDYYRGNKLHQLFKVK